MYVCMYVFEYLHVKTAKKQSVMKHNKRSGLMNGLML